MEALIIALVASLGALGFAMYVARGVIAEDQGDDTMKSIALAIQEGASAFLKREYTFLAAFVVYFFVNWNILSFLWRIG